MKLRLLPILLATALSATACESLATQSAKTASTAPAAASTNPADLNDLEIAHVAYTADNIDIEYAKIALRKTSSPEVRAFAETMVRDHEMVNELALGLLKKLDAQPQDNFLSQKLTADAAGISAKLESLNGSEFDMYYASNELGYHKAVNNLVETAFIPNIENAEMKELFKAGLEIFKAHEVHAEMMVKQLGG